MWLKTVKRADRKKLVSREAFSLIYTAKMFVSARARLEQMGIYEVARGEEDEFHARATKELRIVRRALGWAQDAGRALAAINYDFAKRLYPHNEADLVSRADYSAWFAAPVNA